MSRIGGRRQIDTSDSPSGKSTRGRSIISEGLSSIEGAGQRIGPDTIKLWEGYREQAMLWRALALLQFPVSIMSLIFALIMYFSANTIIEIPPVPQPGYYSVEELPDSTYINVAQEVVNLIATFQSDTIESQFAVARKYMWEPALSAMQSYMNAKIPQIKKSNLSQTFFITPNLTRVERGERTVTVHFRGTKYSFVGKRQMEPKDQVYVITMSTIPRNISNEYGVVVVGVQALKPSSEGS